MGNKKKLPNTYRYEKGLRKGQRVSKQIKFGTARRTQTKRLQCKKCNRWFSSLKELNLHYSARGHTRKSPAPKSLTLREFKSLPEETQKSAIAIAQILVNKNEFKRKMREYVRERLHVR